MDLVETRGVRMKVRSLATGVVLVSTVAATAAAFAADPIEQAPVAPLSIKSSAAFAVAPVAGDRLATQRGGAVQTVVDQNGRLSDATAINVSTGSNAIRDSAFANAAGLNTVIQNSGANVLIQNSMTVNVQFK